MFAQRATGECVPTILSTPRILDLAALGRRAASCVPVLIRGEAGVGEDILARLIHADSARRDYAFIKVKLRGAAYRRSRG